MVQRKHYLFVCTNRRPEGEPKGSCAARGAIEVHARLKELLKAEGLAVAEARVCTCSCLDFCSAGTVIAVEPDGYFYARVTPADVPDIVRSIREGQRVERLVQGPNSRKAMGNATASAAIVRTRDATTALSQPVRGFARFNPGGREADRRENLAQCCFD